MHRPTGRRHIALVGNDPATGQLRGLAIYHRELTAAEVVHHYETWTGKGQPDLTGEERCVALDYLFREQGGGIRA